MQLDFNSPESLFSLLGCPTCTSPRKKKKGSTWYAVLTKWFEFWVLSSSLRGFYTFLFRFFPLFFLLFFFASKSPCWNGLLGQVGGWLLPTLFAVSLFGHKQSTAPAVHAQLKKYKAVIYLWAHTHTQDSKFKTCWAIHYPDKKIKVFLPARQTQAQRRWASLWSSLEQVSCVTKLPPLHHLC